MNPADDERLFSVLRAAATAERAPRRLGARVLERIEQRSALAVELRPQRRSMRSLPLMALGGALALAAVLVLRLQVSRTPAPIAPEARSAVAASAPPADPAPAKQGETKAPNDPCAARVVASGRAPLIDDFEDGDDALLPVDGRSGFWRWAREIDAPGSAPALLPVPRPAPTRASRMALHVKGGQLFDWGATVELTFRPACYDASAYRGIGFVARGPGRIYVAPREVAVIPVSDGGSCERDCYNPHVKKVDLTPDFRHYEFEWSEFHQRGAGKPALDASRLNSIAFMVRPEDTPYDVWFDEVRWLTR